MHGHRLGICTDHGGVDHGDSDLVLAHSFFGVRERVCVNDVVQATGRLSNRGQKLFVLCQYEDVDRS